MYQTLKECLSIYLVSSRWQLLSELSILNQFCRFGVFSTAELIDWLSLPTTGCNSVYDLSQCKDPLTYSVLLSFLWRSRLSMHLFTASYWMHFWLNRLRFLLLSFCCTGTELSTKIAKKNFKKVLFPFSLPHLFGTRSSLLSLGRDYVKNL